MPSISGSLTVLQPLVDVQVAPIPPPDTQLTSPAEFQGEHYLGLIDTGCTRTCVTSRVVERLGLRPVTRLTVATATEIHRRRAFEFRLGFIR